MPSEIIKRNKSKEFNEIIFDVSFMKRKINKWWFSNWFFKYSVNKQINRIQNWDSVECARKKVQRIANKQRFNNCKSEKVLYWYFYGKEKIVKSSANILLFGKLWKMCALVWFCCFWQQPCKMPNIAIHHHHHHHHTYKID